jgi:hypothetical protein
MQILINGSRKAVGEFAHLLPLGYLVNPGGGVNVTEAAASGLDWGLDNGAFGETPEWKFWRAVRQIRRNPLGQMGLKFVVPPDVPFSGRGTIEKFWGWMSCLASPDENLDLPLALVGQNGMEDCDWDFFFGFSSCFFIGGDDAWKESDTAADLARHAKARGQWVHMGRVNSVKRLRIAIRMGCDSVDGTGLTKHSRKSLPLLARHVFPRYRDVPWEVVGGGP